MDILLDYKKNENSSSIQYQKNIVCKQSHICRSMDGWKLYVCCKDSLTYWKPPRYLKFSHLVQVEDYAIVQGIEKYTAFN